MQPKFPLNTIAELADLLGISERHLWHIAETTESSYSRWQQPKASGGFRELSSPNPQLKEVQKKLHRLIFSRVALGPFSHYGIKRKSNITNACEHSGNAVISTFDLRSFFPSIRPERVKRALVDELGCPDPPALLIAKLVSVNYQLPQGAPTSTDIANIVTLRLQRRLYHLARQWGIRRFTIFADDVTFSDNHIPKGFRRMVAKVIREEGFKIHPEKKKGGTFNKSAEQVVTGVNITHGPTVGKLRKIWRAERHGNTVRHEGGYISSEEFETSERKYASRLVYTNSVRKSNRRVSRRSSGNSKTLS
jgi:RNA-directed DNA polymerase